MIGTIACFLVAVSCAAACAPIDRFRSAYVVSKFDGAGVEGLWYENAFEDLAQIGASCQTFNKTLLPDGKSVLEDFDVFYGELPFKLPLVFNASVPGPNGTWTSERGVFSRSVEGLGSLISFPSVVVDVDEGTPPKGWVGPYYTALIEYLCLEVLGITYEEIRVSTRVPSPPDSYVSELEQRARALGLNFTSLAPVNHTNCKPFPPGVAPSVALPRQ
jgi:hypothetical protein